MYKQLIDPITGKVSTYNILRVEDYAFIPFDPANTDYQTFKTAINDQTAQLEDADGNLMTPEQAIEYVGTLP